MHPGEAAAAEAAASAAQRQALQGLPDHAGRRVRVVASVCHDLASFLYSQPDITQLPSAWTGISASKTST